MVTYVIRRILLAIIVLIIVSLITFFVMRLLPGDPIIIFIGRSAGSGTLPPQQLQALYHQYGLDRPLIMQYFNWITGFLRGNMGQSIYYHQNISQIFLQRFPVTLDLGIESFIVSNVLGVVLGIVAAVRRGKWLDSFSTVISYIGVSMPVFWLAIIMMYIFGLKLHWFPIAGYVLPWQDLGQNLYKSVMPVICLSLMGWAVVMRQTRSERA